MLCWVVCWLHGHVVCDGNVMVGIFGGGWLGEWVGGWSGRSHISVHCAHINSAQSIPVKRCLGGGLLMVDLGNPVR